MGRVFEVSSIMAAYIVVSETKDRNLPSCGDNSAVVWAQCGLAVNSGAKTPQRFPSTLFESVAADTAGVREQSFQSQLGQHKLQH